ncbi:GNAT family N-acetyltransferase [Pseudomonas chlororaphis]|nr:GNAT family N-acetyltransferase [Pseudomonas chlororaphis]
MPTISLLHTPPSEPLKSQLLQMVVDYVSDISAVAIAPSNPLYPLYQYTVGLEVHRYLDAMDGTRGLSVELALATDEHDPETLIGFALYLPLQDDPDACAVAYLAVREGHRRQGVARALLAPVQARYPQVEVACGVGKVACFEALGFQLIGARGPQVLMNTRDHGSDGLLAVLDVAPIFSSLEVRQIHAYLLQQHGRKAMLDAEKKRDRHLDQLTRQAQALVLERLGPDALGARGPGLRLV